MVAPTLTYALACLGVFALGALASLRLWPQGVLPARFVGALGAGVVLAALAP
jgi:hypothetical protein